MDDRMNKKIKIGLIATILLVAGCTTGEQDFSSGGVRITNELSSERMQPGGTVLLRTSVNNFFDNQLTSSEVKLVRSFGQLTVDSLKKDLGDVQANPNATARQQWTLTVRPTASSGTVFTNKVRLCFTYNQTSWHEIVLVDSFERQEEAVINQASETGPLRINFAGLDMAYIRSEEVVSQIPISVSIKNNYDGYVGGIDMSKDDIPNLTYIEMRIYDSSNNSPWDIDGDLVIDKTITPEHFGILPDFTNPSCIGKTEGCFNCSNFNWVANPQNPYFKCYAHNLSVFGDETFIGTKLNVTKLETEELVQIVEVLASYDYCIESEEFELTVFNPGGS
jgi:hypothetical protein